MAKSAEERVFARLREALPAPYRLYPNVRWLGKADADAPARDGETDLLIVHPEHGLLVVETKGGRIRHDGQGRWWSGEYRLDPPPFTQAENSKHALTRAFARPQLPLLLEQGLPSAQFLCRNVDRVILVSVDDDVVATREPLRQAASLPLAEVVLILHLVVFRTARIHGVRASWRAVQR